MERARQNTNSDRERPVSAALSLAAAWLFILALPPVAWASDITPQEPPDGHPTEEEQAIDEVTHPFPHILDEVEGPPEPASIGEDDCDWELEEQPFQEQSQEVIRSWSCHSFRWFDGWWGDEEEFPEDEVNGWITMGTAYRKYDGWDPRLRIKVRAPLPNLNKRWDLIFGRMDEEAFVSDTQAQDSTFYNPGVIDRGEDEQWLLGLGKHRRNQRQGWDWSAGVRLRLPPRPYAKVAYFYNRQPTKDTDLRLRQTFFWRSDDGFGTTSRGDLAWAISATDVLRWEATATVHEDTDGVRWFLGQTWYHLMGERGAFSLLAFARGETDDPVEVKDGGLNLIWRRTFTRDWMYISLGPSITWPRRKPEEKREFNLGFGIWLEMEFGDWRY